MSNQSEPNNSASPSSNRTSNDLVFLLAKNNDPFEEGDTIESKPPGLFLVQLHGQLVLYQGDPTNDESIILLKSQPYIDDGSGYSSTAFLHQWGLAMYSETFRKQKVETDSLIWYSRISDKDDCCDIFLAWNRPLKRLVVHEGSINSPGNEVWNGNHLYWSPLLMPNDTSADMVLLVKEDTNIVAGFIIESQPPGLFLQHDKGNLYLYRGMPLEPTSHLLWKTEYAYTYNGDPDLTSTQFQNDGNLVIYARDLVNEPHERYSLWESGSSVVDEGSCFLAWIPSEERLAIFSGNITSPGQEVWTSLDFRWEPAHPDLNYAGQITVSSLTRFTSICSVIGSGLIIGILLSKWSKKKKVLNTRDRLLLGMSSIDLVASIANAFDVNAFPADTYGIVGAMGNQATCNLQGFFIQLGFGVPLYNAMLCVYTLLIVRMKWTDKFIAVRIEPFMHVIVLGYTLTSATLGLVLDLYNSNGSFCWIEMYPHDCAFAGYVKCIRGENAGLYQWIFAGVVLISCFVIIITSMSIIYLFIRKNVQKMKERYGESSVVNKTQLQEVGKQAFLYVAAFIITFIWPMLVAIERQLSIKPPFWQNLVLSFFFTFQGFWNFLIFIRPEYNWVRRRNKEKSSLWALGTAIRRATKSPIGGSRRNLKIFRSGSNEATWQSSNNITSS